VSRWAYREAIAHIGRGLEMLGQLPVGRMRQQIELELRLALGGASIKGWTASEAQREFGRTRQLAEQVDDPQSLAHATYGIWANQFLRDDGPLAVRTAHDLLQLSDAYHYVAG
jgi:hypothetical protein